jgi:hypothetical protein
MEKVTVSRIDDKKECKLVSDRLLTSRINLSARLQRSEGPQQGTQVQYFWT